MKRKNLLLIALVITLIASMLTGCTTAGTKAPTGSTSGTTTPSKSDQPAQKAKIAIIVKSTGNPFMEKMADGFKTAVEETEMK